MIVVVGGSKGGCGKTAVATNLTVIRSQEGRKVLLIDADEQRSALKWSNQREVMGIETNWSTVHLSGKSIYAQINRIKTDYDDIIVDVGGRDTTSQRSALAVADVYIIPFRPSSVDVWTIGEVTTIITEMKLANPKLKSYAFVNCADPSGTDNDDTLSILQECEEFEGLKIMLGNRKTYRNSASNGLGIVEVKNPDKKAIQEIKALYEFIYKNGTI